jgi:hypothetical protein
MEVCTGKLNRCEDNKICETLILNEAAETPVTSTFLSVACLDFKSDHMQSTFLHIKTAERDNTIIKKIMEYCYRDKGS